MPVADDHMTHDKYDKEDVESILRHAAKMTGKRFGDLVHGDVEVIGGKHSKGTFGQVVETMYFDLPNNSRPSPDFESAGIELKVTPMKKVRGGYASKERLVLGIIDYNTVPEKGFRTFTDKNSHLLIAFYLWTPDTKLSDYRFLKVVDWIPTSTELRIIREDWNIIQGYVMRGEAHLLSERHTKFLAANRKGVGHGKDERSQPFSDILAQQRSLSFKPSFMDVLFHSKPDLNDELVEEVELDGSLSEPTGTVSIMNDRWSESESFEIHILNRMNRFRGMRCRDIEEALETYLSDDGKQYYHNLTMAMLGVKGKRRAKELDQANILVKTARIKLNGMPKESTSFRAFKFNEVAAQEWEESDFYSDLDRTFLFVVYGFTTDDPAKEARKDLVFKGAFFWNIPEHDLEIVKEVWYDTRSKIRALDMDHFVRASDDRISHVRPHAKDKTDTYPYLGIEYVKKCFWFNDKYVKSVIEEHLIR